VECARQLERLPTPYINLYLLIQADSALSTQHSSFSTSAEFPGVPFILASLMLLSAAMIAWRTTKSGGS